MTLKELPNTVVHLLTQEEYDELMQIYEDAGWRWINGYKPTGFNGWCLHKENTCIRAYDKFAKCDIGYYKRKGVDIITLDEFKKKQPSIQLARVLQKSKQNNFMNNIKNKFKALTLGEPKKSFVKAGFMTIDGVYSQEVKDWALDEIINKHIESKGFQDKLVQLAEDEE